MRLVVVAIIGLALLLSVAVFFVVPRLMRSPAPTTQQAQQVEHIAAKEVLVAAHNIPSGQALKAEDMRWQKWPEEGVDQSYLVHENGEDAKNYVGMIALHGIEAGQPIIKSRLLKPGDTSFMAAELPPGMRALSIKIDNISQTSGFILPGDYVDVMLTEHYTIKPTPTESKLSDVIGAQPFDQREVNSIVLRDVKVLAIDQTVQDLDSKPRTGGTATLELTLEDAQKLSLAGDIGSLSLLLRSHELPEHPEAEGTPTTVQDYQVSNFRAALLEQYLARVAQAEAGQGGGGLRVYNGTSLAK
jgi:pilus assembly protein CpaB